MDNRTEAINNPKRELLIKVRRSERSLATFIERVAKNREIKQRIPNHHALMTSLYEFRSVRGFLTDKQKFMVNKELDKYADVYIELMTSKPVISEESEERAAIQDESRAQDENAPIPEE